MQTGIADYEPLKKLQKSYPFLISTYQRICYSPRAHNMIYWFSLLDNDICAAPHGTGVMEQSGLELVVGWFVVLIFDFLTFFSAFFPGEF